MSENPGRDTQDNEITNLYNRFISELQAQGSDTSNPNTQKGLKAQATAIVKWQRDREDNAIDVKLNLNFSPPSTVDGYGTIT